jgi:hypothetical protein
MDRFVKYRVERDLSLEVSSFKQLAETVRHTTKAMVVVGINALISNDSMRMDTHYDDFLTACHQSTHMHRNAILAWIDGINEYHHASIPWKFMPDFKPH